MTMTIGGLAREGGVGVETVRYYQRRGLLAEPPRTGGDASGDGIRRYDDEAVRRLRFVRSAQAAGFTLDEIGALLSLDATNDRTTVRSMAHRRIAALEDKIRDLQLAKDWLNQLADQCGSSDAGPCPILMAFETIDSGHGY